MSRYPRDTFVRHVADSTDLLPGEHILPERQPCHHHRYSGIASTTAEEWARGIERERAMREGSS